MSAERHGRLTAISVTICCKHNLRIPKGKLATLETTGNESTQNIRSIDEIRMAIAIAVNLLSRAHYCSKALLFWCLKFSERMTCWSRHLKFRTDVYDYSRSISVVPVTISNTLL